MVSRLAQSGTRIDSIFSVPGTENILSMARGTRLGMEEKGVVNLSDISCAEELTFCRELIVAGLIYLFGILSSAHFRGLLR